MRKFVIAVLVMMFSGEIALAQTAGQQQKRRPNALPPIEDAVEGFYINRFPQQVEVSDEQFVKVLPILRQFLREKREISARKTRALNQIRQTIQRGDPDEDIKRLIREMDKADADNQTSQEKFLNAVDPILTSMQQAKLRVFQFMIDQQIRRMIERARQQGRGVQPQG